MSENSILDMYVCLWVIIMLILQWEKDGLQQESLSCKTIAFHHEDPSLITPL